MRWTVHGERQLYTSPWVSLGLADVEIPGGARFEHHVVHARGPAVGTVLARDGAILLLYRHRFITDSWGWEIPAGGVEPGEEFAAAAHRECVEETGWAPGPLTRLTSYYFANGLCDGQFVLFLGDRAEHVGEPVDAFESDRIEWVPIPEVRRLVASGGVPDGLTLTALLWMFAFRDAAGW
jgi:8-oxo-dGTP pyrophosphatase MutT (NUDIX family)